MADNAETFSNIAGKTDYPTFSEMRSNGVWATEVEIFAYATLLATPICVFGPNAKDKAGNPVFKWQQYSQVCQVAPASGLTQSLKNIFISNIGHHYEPVFDM